MSISEEKKYLKKANFKKELSTLKNTLKDKKILIYGAGILFETAYKTYDFNGLNIVGISDKKFETDDSIEKFCNIKTFKPDEIKNLDIDCILVSIKEYNNLVKCFITKYPNLSILPLVKKPQISTFRRRNINHNIFVDKKGLHGKKVKNLSNFKIKLLEFKSKLNNILGRLEIPQIEFNITTTCTLKCKHCSNFIPYLKREEQCPMTINDFKIKLDNLLKAVHKIKNLLLIGGEPLLVKNLHEYLEYAASKKKIERVWIVTNGTLLMNKDLYNTAIKYRNKLTIWVSNYSQNEELKPILKHEELFKQIKEANLDYDFTKDLSWGYTSPLESNKKRENSKDYFKYCNNNCVAVFANKMYVCPRAGTFELKKIYTPKENDYVDLDNKNPKSLKKKLIEFYSKNSFSACDYCTILEDREKERVLPAIQN